MRRVMCIACDGALSGHGDYWMGLRPTRREERQVTALGPRLRELRKARGLTIRAVAEQVGVHFTTISKFENGHEQPGEQTIRALAAVLIADPEGLLALGGKVPAELAQLAAADPQFAMLLRRLPLLPPATLERIYVAAGLEERGRCGG